MKNKFKAALLRIKGLLGCEVSDKPRDSFFGKVKHLVEKSG